MMGGKERFFCFLPELSEDGETSPEGDVQLK